MQRKFRYNEVFKFNIDFSWNLDVLPRFCFRKTFVVYIVYLISVPRHFYFEILELMSEVDLEF